MGSKTGIEWTDATWNPFIGCSRVSEGCRHCYAETISGRFSHSPASAPVYQGLTQLVNGSQVWTGRINQAPRETLLKPLSWRAPRRVFVNSMSDLFHEAIPDELIDQVFAIMSLCPQHKFQVLTKRAERMREYCSGPWYLGLIPWLDKWQKRPAGWGISLETVSGCLPNLWLGVSVENQAAADERIPLLLQTPAAVRFISAEPLLGPVNLRALSNGTHDALSASSHGFGVSYPALDWVICGGESGHEARPMHPKWARSLRDQCTAAGVPFFFKQWGEWFPTDEPFVATDSAMNQTHPGRKKPPFTFMQDSPRPAGHVLKDKDIREAMVGRNGQGFWKLGKEISGAELDGREWRELPGAPKPAEDPSHPQPSGA